MVDAPGGERRGQRLGDVLLPDHVGEGCRSVLPVERHAQQATQAARLVALRRGRRPAVTQRCLAMTAGPARASWPCRQAVPAVGGARDATATSPSRPGYHQGRDLAVAQPFDIGEVDDHPILQRQFVHHVGDLVVAQ